MGVKKIVGGKIRANDFGMDLGKVVWICAGLKEGKNGGRRSEAYGH